MGGREEEEGLSKVQGGVANSRARGWEGRGEKVAANPGRGDFRLGGVAPFGRVVPRCPIERVWQGLASPGRSDGEAGCITPSAPPQRPPRVTGSSH